MYLLCNLHMILNKWTYVCCVIFYRDQLSVFFRGSISAEHGLGFKKRQFIYHSKSTSAVKTMQQIKKIFDPNGILNPYKTLPDE